MKKFLAFTLAETLIVMGVIGIVSALTLPNLNSSTGDKERVAKVKKIYRDLNDAFGRAEAVYGNLNNWFINDSPDKAKCAKRAGERITEFMKVSKNCEMNSGQGCFTAGKAKKLKGGELSEIDTQTAAYKIISADGMSISIESNGETVSFTVDIDGPSKGSFTYGKDLFVFQTQDNLLLPYNCYQSFAYITDNILNDTGTQATTWIINYDNADYLKLGSDGKCPNGTTPTESNPRCK